MELVHAVYEPLGPGPHPAVVALHGWGASALDLLGLAPHLGAGRFLVLCPQGPMTVPVGAGMNGYGWFPISMGSPPDPAAFGTAVSALDDFLAAARRRYPIAADRVALLGFSQGGAMAYALALRHGRAFAAVAALSTWLAPGLMESGGDRMAGLPVLVQHGTRDELIGVERGRASVEKLRGAGAQVVWREYEMGHEISPASLRDLDGFLGDHLLSRIVRP